MMQAATAETVKSHDVWINTSRGKIYAKHWATNAADDAFPPLVLFHDSLGCVDLWRDFPERLVQATSHTVFAYDRLGFGKSDAYPGTLEVTFVRDEARTTFDAVRQQLDLNTFIALGHSVGGGMAVGVAAQFPQSCLALITESAQAFVEDRTITGIQDAKKTFAQPGQIERLARYHGDKAAWVLNAWIETWLSPAFADWNLDADLRALRCPLLALHGQNDEYGSTQHPERIARLAGGPSEMEIFEACGHVPHREMPEKVISRIANWLRSV